jgi:hypothetical protein
MIELKQRHVEAFFKAMRLAGINSGDMSAPEYAGAVVRAAASAGMLDAPDIDVGEMLPREVVKLAREVNNAITEALTLDAPLS